MTASARVELDLVECEMIKEILSEYITHLEINLDTVDVDKYAFIKAAHGKFSAFCNVLEKKEGI